MGKKCKMKGGGRSAHIGGKERSGGGVQKSYYRLSGVEVFPGISRREMYTHPCTPVGFKK